MTHVISYHEIIAPLTPEDAAIILGLASVGNISTYTIESDMTDARLVRYLLKHPGETASFVESEAGLDAPEEPFFDDPNYATQ